jgi:galactose oxidase
MPSRRLRCYFLFKTLLTMVLSLYVLAQPHLAVALDCNIAPDNGTPACIGQWTPPFKWGTTDSSKEGTVAVHLNVLPTGKVFGWSRGGTAGASGYFGVEPVVTWDPTTNLYTEAPPMDDLFCSGHAFLPDGRLLVSGGVLEGAAVAAPYDWRTGVWGTAVRMNNERYYPSVLPLANGEQLVIAGGTDTGENTIPQVWTLNGTFRDLTGANRKLQQYPWVFLAPDNRVFIAGPESTSFWLTTSSTGSIASTGIKHSTGNGWWRNRIVGSAVMYKPGKVLITGGADRDGTTFNASVTATAEVIDLNVNPPVWQKAGPYNMAKPSVDHMLILLPDGNVFKVGGTTSMKVTPEGYLAHDPDETKAILTPEMWKSSSMRWRSMAAMRVPRIYHSAGVLLPDGRVLVAGGGKKEGFTDHRDAEIYAPPYLFNGSRPTISGIASQSGNNVVRYGESFTVMTPNTNITRATLIRLPAMSHSSDWNQLFNELTGLTKVSGGYRVTAPSSKTACPPGHYYLHLLNSNGVPSVAKIIQIPVS